MLGASLGPIGPALADLSARVRRWPVESQQGARRNAMVACTASAQRRAERIEAASFVARRTAARAERAADSARSASPERRRG